MSVRRADCKGLVYGTVMWDYGRFGIWDLVYNCRVRWRISTPSYIVLLGMFFTTTVVFCVKEDQLGSWFVVVRVGQSRPHVVEGRSRRDSTSRRCQ